MPAARVTERGQPDAHRRSSPTIRATAASASRTGIAETFGKRSVTARTSASSSAGGSVDGGEVGLRRRFERARREHDREIDAEPRPIDLAQIGDARGDLAAEQVDGQRVADLEPHAARQLGVERDQRRAVVVGRPPFAGDECASRAGRLAA